MDCKFCPTKAKLISIQQYTGEAPHSHDFDKDGKLYKVCPNCSTCDSMSLRSDRELQLNILKKDSIYSRRDKKAVLHLICDKLELSREDRNITVSDLMEEIKDMSDSMSVTKLSEKFEIKKSRIETLFYNVKVYRKNKRSKK